MSSEDGFYPEGRECGWLASDQAATVAFILTAGVGPIPERVFGHTGAPLRDIEKQIEQLPPVSSTRLLVSVKRPEGYLAAARRGFFVYDWTDVHKTTADEQHTYELVAAPEAPLHVDSLPAGLQEAAKAVTFMDQLFTSAARIDVLKFGPCRVSSSVE